MQNHMGMGALTDKEARAAGFKDVAEMSAFYENRRRMRLRGGDAPGTKGKTSAEPAKKPKAASRGLWGRLSDAVTGAMGN